MRIEASNTGDARAGPGGFANSGVHIGDVYLLSASPVRSGYLHQVRRIAPPDLLARQRELADLAAFCTGSAPGAYQWWQAPAWSGKTALMSWFTLNPPPGVRIVSFFVTARLSGQSGRTAFVDNVLEQLQALVGPVSITEATRSARLAGLLETAAHACRTAGETLVLLVDGLDEDQAADAQEGEDRSIAALLPMDPPAGLRIIVSGRPNPPIPGDVPAHHPLRTAVVCPLSASAAARVARTDMERELEHLLQGAAIEQDLLGLLVAAGGGLTGADLAELTGRTHEQVDSQLRTIAGRSFTKQRSKLRPGESPDLYLLGHEELHVRVVAAFGDRLSAYRERLYAWADRYRERRWPSVTPEYLLHGYHSMLLAAGEIEQAVELSTDVDRHDRMLDLSGGVALALDEITTLLDLLTADELPAMVRLSIHRVNLGFHVLAVPVELPVQWVALGHHNRALALARSTRSSDALRTIAAALFAAGQSEYAHQAVDHLIAQTSAVTFEMERNNQLSQAITMLVVAGELDRASTVEHFVDSAGWIANSWLDAAAELAEAGAHERARAVLHRVGSVPPEAGRVDRVCRIAAMARVHAMIGDRKIARRLASQARGMVQELAEQRDRARVASAVVRCLTVVGPRLRLHTFAKKATALVSPWSGDHDTYTTESVVRALAEAGAINCARSVTTNTTDRFTQERCAEHLAVAYARKRDYRSAELAIEEWCTRSHRSKVWFAVAREYVRSGEHALAWTIASRLRDQFAHDYPNPDPTMAQAVRIFCAVEDFAEAEATVESTTSGRGRAEVLSVLAEALIRRGERARAEMLLRRAEAAVLGSDTLDRQADGYLVVAEALLDAGQVASARTIGEQLPRSFQRARLLHAEVRAGVAKADAAEQLVALSDPANDAPQVHEWLVDAHTSQILAWAADAFLRRGDSQVVPQLLDQAERVFERALREDEACGAIASAWVRIGNPVKASEVVLGHRAAGWERLFKEFVAAAETDQARTLAREVDSWYCGHENAHSRASLRASLIRPLVEAGEVEHAREIAGEILAYLDATPDPEPSSTTLGALVDAVFALYDPEDLPDVVARVRTRIDIDALTIQYQSGLAIPIAEVMVRAGDLDGALELGATVVDPYRRREVLLHIAVQLLRNGDAEAARSVVAEALRLDAGGNWHYMLDKVGGFLPEVTTAAGTTVLKLIPTVLT